MTRAGREASPPMLCLDARKGRLTRYVLRYTYIHGVTKMESESARLTPWDELPPRERTIDLHLLEEYRVKGFPK